jgi:hypothetical protein
VFRINNNDKQGLHLRRIFAFFWLLLWLPLPAQTTVHTLYGDASINHPLVKDLLQNPTFKRLQLIDNAGPNHYFRSLPPYSLFDYALGVFALLQRYDRPFNEQIAGLLEPVSHSAFSHQGSVYLHVNRQSGPYYLANHTAFLKASGLETVLNKYNFAAQQLDPRRKEFAALYQTPPSLSAIEIEMTLKLAYAYKLLGRQEINVLLKDLKFDKSEWYFTSQKSAKKLGQLSLYFAEKYWGSPHSYVVNRWIGVAIQRAIDLELLSIEDALYGVDHVILRRLLTIQDDIIQGLLMRCRQPFRFFKTVTDDSYDELFKPDLRAVNPLVEVDGKRIRLSELDAEFNRQLSTLQKSFADGIKIRYRTAETRTRSRSLFNGIFPTNAQIKVD